jgi:outer membrane receptor protein involved in Fe transport
LYTQFDGGRGPDTAARWNWQIGLRMEQVWNTTTSELLQTNRGNDYFNLFPSAKIKRTHGDASTSALSYGRRINRPGLGQLNPFIDITDSLNQYGGNPALVPELVDAIELAHDRSVRKGDLGLRAFYRRARNSIQTFTVLDSNGVAFSRPENFGAMHTAGGELLLAFPVTRFCNVNLSASLYQQWLDDPLLENELLAWYGKAIVAIVPWKSAKLQVAANYTAPVLLPQGKVEAVYFVDAGFTQSFANGRGRIGITGQDLFRTMVTRRQLSSEDFTFTRSFRVDSRAVLFSLGWTFGGEFKEQVMENRFKND